MGWLTALLAIVEAVPEVVSVVTKLIDTIKGHPAGTAAGVQAVSAHLDTYQQPVAEA